MDDRMRQLRVRVRVHQRGRPVTAIRYPDGLRDEIVAVVREAQAQGIALRRLARTVGVPACTLTLWLRRAGRQQFRRVTLTAAPVVPPPLPLVLVTPQGMRVEGLDLAGMVTVLRTLA
jgi:transposase-like protein